MQVKDIIEALRKNYNKDDELVIAWWDWSVFDIEPNSEQWADFVTRAEDRMDWAETHEALEYVGFQP